MHSYNVNLQTKRPVSGQKSFYYGGVIARNSKHAIAKASNALVESTKNKVVVVKTSSYQNY